MRKVASPSVSLKDSWELNAGRWTAAVRKSRIPSRAAGTDQAILNAVINLHPKTIIDIGCGEGWLVRRLKGNTECVATGVDGSERLIANAKSAHADGNYFVLDYSDLARQPEKLQGPYDVVVCNFSLLDEALVPILTALKQNLTPKGTLVIQTLHPWAACGPEYYVDGWRNEEFAGFAGDSWQPMPWYFRTLGRWFKDLGTAGFFVKNCVEPTDSDTRQPLSMLLLCEPK